jgi:hypothetical protein
VKSKTVTIDFTINRPVLVLGQFDDDEPSVKIYYPTDYAEELQSDGSWRRVNHLHTPEYEIGLYNDKKYGRVYLSKEYL